LLAAGMLAFSSCESEVITTTPHKPIDTATYRLIIEPSHLEGEQYQAYEFTARINDISSDKVIFLWDFGLGFREEAQQPILWTFPDHGIYIIRVKAVNAADNALIAFDSIRADIRPPGQSVKIFPESIDTVLPMSDNGDIFYPLTFKLRIIPPVSGTIVNWDFGDGTTLEILECDTVTHLYVAVGTYSLRVSVRDQLTGLLLGTDTITVNIRFKDFSFEDLILSNDVTVYLMPDSTQPVRKDTLFKSPFAIRLDFMTDDDNTAIIADNKFSVTYNFFDYLNSPRLLLDTITGEFSDDVHMIRKMSVSVNDTGYLISHFRGHLRYSFSLKDLKIAAVTDRKLVYRSTSPFFSDVADDLVFSAEGLMNHPCGLFSRKMGSFVPVPEGKKGSFAVIVFTR
jgi:hypothetical protein